MTLAAVLLLSGFSASAKKPPKPLEAPVIAEVSLANKMTVVTSRLAKKGFVMTGFGNGSCAVRGSFEDFGEVEYGFWADGDGLLDSVRVIVLSRDEWKDLIGGFRAVENRLAAAYGTRAQHHEDYGGDRDYSDDTRYMRLAMGYVVYFSEWEVGIWKIRESIVYKNHTGCICVTMKKGLPEKKARKARQPKAPREKKVKEKKVREKKEKNEKNEKNEKSPIVEDGSTAGGDKDMPSSAGAVSTKEGASVVDFTSSPWAVVLFRVRMGGR